jgi:DNA-binding transcriptional MerR regulator
MFVRFMEKNENNPISWKNWIFRGDQFLIDFHNYFKGSGKEFSNKINKKSKRLNNSEVSYRVINFWEEQNLINSNRPQGKGWRMYSVIDAVWVSIIINLRKFGLSVSQIKEVKKYLEYLNKTIKSDFPILELYIAKTFLKVPVYLLVFNDGEALCVTNTEYNESLELRTIDDHLTISLNAILQDMYPKKDFKPIFERNYNLTKNEENLLYIIRCEDWDTIEINGKDGHIERIDKTVKYDPSTKIIEILNKAEYQDIEIKKTNGKVVSIKAEIKTKME